MQRCPRPGCDRTFNNSRALSSHLSNRYSGDCNAWFLHTSCLQSPPSNERLSDSPQRSTVQDDLPGALSDGSSSLSFESSPYLSRIPRRRGWEERRVRFVEEPVFIDEVPHQPRQSSPPSPLSATPPSPPLSNADLPETPSEQREPLPKRVEHPTAGHCFGYGPTILDQFLTDDRFRKERKGNLFYPFSCEADAEVGFWLMKTGMSLKYIDEFLRLRYVQDRPLSFTSSAQLVDRIELLPKPPSWQCCEVTVEGGRTSKPIKFYHRDGFDCFCFMFGNPIYNGYISLTPYKEYEDDQQNGETLGLVMLASDEAQLTKHYGDKYTYGIYLSCGNISKEIRSSFSAKCWMKIGEIPVVKFEEKECQKLLEARLAHKCLDIVTDRLKKHSHRPAYVPDPAGRIRLLRTILCSHLGDNVEQRRLACVPENSSPVSLAEYRQLGRSTASPPRTAAHTLRRIREFVRQIGDRGNDLPFVKALASRLKLNGVLEPFWRDWKFACPSIFLTPDALHQWHKFFMDHVMEWARHLLSDYEVDKRISVLQKRIGFRAFPTGFTRFTQHTGREERDLQRSFVGIIAGHPKISENVMRAFRGLLDYIYIAQYESQSTETLKLLRRSLRQFHRNKGYLARTGIRDGSRQNGRFKIPKLETFHHTPRIIAQVGSAPQFSTDHSEHLHITNAKEPYKMTNHRDHEEQICRILDRRERVFLFELLAVVWATVIAMATMTSLGSIDPERPTPSHLPSPAKNLFDQFNLNKSNVVLRNSTTAFSLTARIAFRKKSITQASEIFHLPGLRAALLKHYAKQYSNELPFSVIDCWIKVTVQLHTQQNSNAIAVPYTVAAVPSNESMPFGLCNFVLVKHPPGVLYRGIQSGHYIAQLRMVFRPYCYGNGKASNNEVLAYVEPLKPAPGTISLQTDGHYDHVPDDNIEMFRLVRDLNPDLSRRGKIIKLVDIWRPIDIIPKFGQECPMEWTRDTAVELASEFYVNSFADKETFQSVY
ncbi:hypothetical protein SCHPADRAFT_840547 [Schizopora paradoxa]|uniref:DUF6830 domain-containing protein n=1 Tax=Schizopora paradoxa TaxID=27342 RepID=A0A0H2QYL9_9AGAM|nr:hypothetical protein SCHPADRAFT_840547 [Schizopora paradoxa]